MACPQIVVRGYGSFGGVEFLATLGYSSSAVTWTDPTCTITTGVTMTANEINAGITMTANSVTTNIGMGCGNQG